MAKAMSETTLYKDNYAAWCHANDKTLINGSKIYTGTITADKISVNSLEAIVAKIGGFTIGGSALYNGTTTIAGANNSVYLGTDGISCGKDFKVTKDGKIYAVSGQVGKFNLDYGLYASTTGTSDLRIELVKTATSDSGWCYARMYPEYFEVIKGDDSFGVNLNTRYLSFSKDNQSASSYGYDGAIINGDLSVSGTAEFGEINGVKHSGSRKGVLQIGNMVIAFGTASITTGTEATNNMYSGSTDISFGVTFAKTPAILTNWSGSYANMHSTGASNASTTGASVWGRTATASSTRDIQWVAIGAIA
jgi:hypothetical protein